MMFATLGTPHLYLNRILRAPYTASIGRQQPLSHLRPTSRGVGYTIEHLHRLCCARATFADTRVGAANPHGAMFGLRPREKSSGSMCEPRSPIQNLAMDRVSEPNKANTRANTLDSGIVVLGIPVSVVVGRRWGGKQTLIVRGEEPTPVPEVAPRVLLLLTSLMCQLGL